jgi:UDP-N-acetyl-D-mannosaminuronate dehydrogenase
MLKDAKVLVMGATFKENVSDIRNSKVADVIKELKVIFIECGRNRSRMQTAKSFIMSMALSLQTARAK